MVGGPFPVLPWQGGAEGLYWGDPGVGCPPHCTPAPEPPPTSQVQSWLCRPRMVTVPHWPVCPWTKHTAGHWKRDYSTGNLGARGDLPTCPSIVLGPREVLGGGWLGEKPACPSGSLLGGGAVWGVLQTQDAFCPGQGLGRNTRGWPATPAEADGSQWPGGKLGGLREAFGVSGEPLLGLSGLIHTRAEASGEEWRSADRSEGPC